MTPYSLGATEAFDMVFNGGKQDDITVVVACLCAFLPVLHLPCAGSKYPWLLAVKAVRRSAPSESCDKACDSG